MIPRPSVRINAYGDPDVGGHDIDNPTSAGDDLIPPADYPIDKYSPRPDRIRGDVMRTTAAYQDFYPPYSAAPIQYRYVTYNRPDVIPLGGPVYDPYYYGHPGYQYYPTGVNQTIYRIPPGTNFEMIPAHGSRTSSDPEQFEVESVTGRGVPHHVRNITTGERFVVEPPLPIRPDRDQETSGHERRVRPIPRRTNNGVARQVPKFRHSTPQETAGSTSSYTEGSIHTRSGPHFMNGIDYLDVSTRSRILTWLNKSSDRPIRLRPVNNGPHIDSQTGAPLRFRMHQQGHR